MPVFTPQQIKEINTIISDIQKAIIPGCEIGARDKSSLRAVLKANKETGNAHFVACKREYSDAIVFHFVKEKEITKSKHHRNNQSSVFVLKA